jgi:hypothetical protein
MPKATSNSSETERFDLKSCDGAFVELRRMTYGEFMKRRSMSANMRLEQQGKQGMQGILDMMNQKVIEYEFRTCIVDHNLFADDEETIKLDLGKVSDVAKLDPRIGEEINILIDEMNQFESTEEDLGNSQTE